MGRRLLFIFNPKAGKAQIKNKLLEIIDIFTKNGYDEITAYPTQCYMDALEVTKARASDYDLLVCCGGDGTLDEVVTGMMSCEKRIPIGYIPAGSTNDFANSLKIPKNMIKAATAAAQGERFPCDVGCFNEDYFVYIAAFGLFTDVAYQTKQEIKNILGHMAYILEGVKRLYSIKSYWITVSYKEDVFEGEYIYGMVTNSLSVGGFKNITGKNVKLNDGLFEVTLIKMPQNAIELQEIIGALMRAEVDSKYIFSVKADHITISSKKLIPWTLDGEFGGEHSHVSIDNKKHAIEIMLDNGYNKVK